jgi:hypothetical protein
MKVISFLKWKRKSSPTAGPFVGAINKTDPKPAFIPKPTPNFANPNLTFLMFWPNSRTNGWADLDIRLRFDQDDNDYTFVHDYVSWVEDTYGQFVDALIALAEGRAEASAFADMEPQRSEFRFSCTPGTAKTVSLTVFEWTPYRDEGDHLVWDNTLKWTKAGTAQGIVLKHLMDDVLWIGTELEQQFGAEGYRRIWGHRLPTEKIQKLRQLRDDRKIEE